MSGEEIAPTEEELQNAYIELVSEAAWLLSYIANTGRPLPVVLLDFMKSVAATIEDNRATTLH